MQGDLIVVVLFCCFVLMNWLFFPGAHPVAALPRCRCRKSFHCAQTGTCKIRVTDHSPEKMIINCYETDDQGLEVCDSQWSRSCHTCRSWRSSPGGTFACCSYPICPFGGYCFCLSALSTRMQGYPRCRTWCRSERPYSWTWRETCIARSLLNVSEKHMALIN